MALTRAVSDFKDSVKAATTTNITLTGGAPTTIDGVSLSANDSVLVRSQTDSTQNGLYRVTTLGAGANGTWTRRSDFNASNQVSAGALIFVEQGTTNGNVFYYLPGGIGTVSVGSTALNFSNLYSTIGSGSGGTYSNSNVAAYLPTYSGTLTASSVTTTSGGQVVGYITGAIGANTANTGVFTTLTATSGYQGAASGPLNGTLGATTPNSVIATSVTTTSGGQLSGYITGAIGANTANTGAFTTLSTTGNISINNYSNIYISTGSAASTSALSIVGNVYGQGGSGYHDFLKTTSTYSAVTNPNKYFRLNQTGGLEIINSAYLATIFSLSDSGLLNDGIGNVRDIPQNSQSGAYTLVASDNGKHISITTGGVTVPAGVFNAGNSVVIFNNSASSQTITQGASVTMYLSGTATTGNRTLAQHGLCTVLCYATNSFVISGSVT